MRRLWARFHGGGTPEGDEELVALASRAGLVPLMDLAELVERHPEVAAELADFSGDHRAFYRQMRGLSRAFLRFFSADPVAAGPRRQLEQTARSRRTLSASDRGRCVRLALCTAWLLLLGVVGPVMVVVWVTQDTEESERSQRFREHRFQLALLAAASLLVAGCLPAATLEANSVRDAVEFFGGAARSPEEEEEHSAAMLSIGASRKFVLLIKIGLCALSSLGLLITLNPLLGSLMLCAGLFAAALSQSQLVVLDVKLSMLHALHPVQTMHLDPLAHQDVLVGIALREQLTGNDGSQPGQAPSSLTERRMGVVRALIGTCLLVCAARSLTLWGFALRGCADAERDVHDIVCLPSLVAMLCPGFLTIGSLVRFTLLCTGVCQDAGAALEERPASRVCCHAATCVCLWLPTVALHSVGLLLVLKLLADVGHSPLAEVLNLWRVPAWEEVAVLASVAGLWAGLLLLSAVASACLKVLQDTSWPLFISIYASGCLLLEAFLALWSFNNGETFLPRILATVSSMSTAIIALVGTCYIGFTCSGFVGVSFRERDTPGFGYLWG